MWKDIYADFLGGDICRIVMVYYKNPLQVLNKVLSYDVETINDVLGTLIDTYPSWDGYTIEDIINSRGLPYAVAYAFEEYYRLTKIKDPEPYGFTKRYNIFKEKFTKVD